MTKMGRVIVAALAGLMLLVGPAAAAAVKVTVNDIQITDYQISQRAKLFTLENRGGGQNAAMEELITEALMISEAKRIGVVVTDAQVDSAVQSVARNLKVSVENLSKLLADSGVNIDTLKDRLRASIAWNAVAEGIIQPRVQVSDVTLEEQANQRLTGTMSFDYILKEIIFVGGGGRSGQANQYRSNFQGCDSAVELSLKYTDAAVIDVGRRHATQLPEAIATELANLNVGGITKPRVTEQGVSMLAICQKAEARDTTFIKDTILAEAGTDALKGEADAYLKELREKARIYYN
jgi:peptidyl-prolyl cis-trans isomerase SurA